MKIARFSRIGFILAAAGSAIGLGNIWKFPYIAGEYGGGAFVFVYLITVVMIGFTIMIAEMLIGYLGRKDAAASFAALAPKNKRAWSWVGMMGIWAGLWIMTFYSVVIGWILHYIVLTLTGLPASVSEAEALFGAMLSKGIGTQLLYHTLAFFIIAAVLLRGIKAGIERLNLVLMPMLFAIVGGMFLYALRLDGFNQAWAFMFTPNWHKLGSEAFVVAVGHAFFTISLGMGAILTYAASLPKKSNLVESSLSVVALDTLIALLFFVALAFAGLTSAVSLVEPMVQYLIDRYNYSRLRSVMLAAGFFYLVGIVALLSNTQAFGAMLSFGGKNFFDWVDFITSSIMLPLGGLLMALFVGYVLPKSEVFAALHESMGRGFGLWYGVLRYVAPVALLIVMLNLLGIVQF